MSNSHLLKAQIVIDDEFYTLMDDITYYMYFFKDYMKDKIIYLPFDGEESNFTKFFKTYGEALGIKDLIYTSNNYKENEDIFEYISNNDGLIVTNPPFSILSEILDYFKQYHISYIMLSPYIKVCNKSFLSDVFNRVIFESLEIVEGFKRPDGTIANVKCNWINNIKSTQKEEKQRREEERKRKVKNQPDVYNDKGENLSQIYSPLFYFDKLYDFKHEDKTGFKYVIVPVTFVKDEDNLTKYELVQLINPVINGKKIFSRILLRNKQYKGDVKHEQD